jgi:hypothetical protein
MTLSKARSLLAVILILTSAPTSAYKINPLADRNVRGERPHKARLSYTVHEDITHAAISCADGHGLAVPIGLVPLCPQGSNQVSRRPTSGPGNVGNAIIVGIWWNDDPYGYLYRKDVWNGLLAWLAAKRTAGRVRRLGLAQRGEGMSRMLYRSHFDDFQFLHGMAARDADSPRRTQQQIIDWIAFTYRVSTGEIDEGAPLHKISSPLRELVPPADPRWTVSYLFKRSRMNGLATQGLALGSLLHVVQDSFSASHTDRAFDASERCPNGRVTQFYAYQGQQARAHGAEDSRKSFNASAESRFSDLQNPVEASARMILFARRKADWAGEVLPYVLNTLFCVDEHAEVSGPGKFGRLRAPGRLSRD